MSDSGKAVFLSMSALRNTGELSALFRDPRWNSLMHQAGLTDEQLK